MILLESFFLSWFDLVDDEPCKSDTNLGNKYLVLYIPELLYFFHFFIVSILFPYVF